MTVTQLEVRYVARAGSPYSNADAAVIGPALTAITAANDGILAPPMIVEAARPSESPLHPYLFANDDAWHAEQHRLHLARLMVRAIMVVRDEEKGSPAFYHTRAITVTSETIRHEFPQGVYVPLATVVSNPDVYADVVAQALRELRSFRAKYEELLRLNPRFATLGKAIEQVLHEGAPELGGEARGER